MRGVMTIGDLDRLGMRPLGGACALTSAPWRQPLQLATILLASSGLWGWSNTLHASDAVAAL